MPITESRADQTLSFRAEPKSVAEACQRVLGELGEVESVSRETGIIAGRLKVTWATNWVYVTLRISMSGEETQVAIQTQRKEGLLTEGGAQRGLVMFTERLGQELGGKGAAGW
jgi:hypothetical protein